MKNVQQFGDSICDFCKFKKKSVIISLEVARIYNGAKMAFNNGAGPSINGAGKTGQLHVKE